MFFLLFASHLHPGGLQIDLYDVGYNHGAQANNRDGQNFHHKGNYCIGSDVKYAEINADIKLYEAEKALGIFTRQKPVIQAGWRFH